jgi:RNA-directed DNA polymerase
MKLMLRSYFNLLLSVRRVTQENQGKNTAGTDDRLALTPKSRMTLIRGMVKQTPWKVRPARRVYIPKAGKPGQARPLGIPTIENRVAQAVVKNALEPSWEARFETNSYGFRPGRSTHDAIAQCWNILRGTTRRPWILDADIKGAFDEIDHRFILQALGPVPGRELIKQWLKAGYVESDVLHATESGTPQGGIISPLLLNVALHGLQQRLGAKYGFVRYADDFVVTASSREQIERIVPLIEEWLAERGLALHPEKTRIVHIDDGFNFLGFSLRRYRGKCLIKPQKDKVLVFLRSIRQWLSNHRQMPVDGVIRHLNPILRGWSNYYKHVVSKQVFSFVSHRLWQMLWHWCLRRHPNKGTHWVRRNYFGTSGTAWNFQARCRNANGENYTVSLFSMASIPIERHVKVRGTASPDDPGLRAYWLQRSDERKTRRRHRKVAATLQEAVLEA